jgi:hypothetical protein
MEAPRSMTVLTRVKSILLPSRWMRKLHPCYGRNCTHRLRFAVAGVMNCSGRFQLRAAESHDTTVIRVTPGLCDFDVCRLYYELHGHVVQLEAVYPQFRRV